jgi:molecular chaperone GrpE
VEAVLADFRTWLLEAAAPAPNNGQPAAEPVAEPPDLHTLLGQMLALRQEVNLQTRSARGLQEQAAEALRQLGQAVELLRQRPEPPAVSRSQDTDEAVRPLLKTLVDVHDALSLAAREVQRVQANLLPVLDQLADAHVGSVHARAELRLPFLARLFGAGKVLAASQEENTRQEQQAQTRRDETGRAIARVRQLVTSMVTGYSMSVQRLDRALQQAGLEPISVLGLPFDPECMEAVEVVSRPETPGSEVLEEVRRGYLWRSRTFRCALVKVARPGLA